MAVNLPPLPEFAAIDGLEIAVLSAGIKKPGKKDLTVFALAEGSSTAGVFTRNAFCAAPVQIAKAHLAAKSPRYLVINTGNANAGTGDDGYRRALAVCQSLADIAACDVEEVLPFSTGVIGETLPSEKIVAALPGLNAGLSADNWSAAASGIMTTDTLPKGSTRSLEIEGQTISISGISKGAGMIKPNMATMLSYVATDAAVAPQVLQQILERAVAASFNRITVDGDTSTNDAAMLIATGRAGNGLISDLDSAAARQLQDALTEVYIELAHAIVRDAEGATKFVAVNIRNGRDPAECLKAAYTIAESPLVKTALFASDPNWGRILAALGRAGLEDLDVSKVALSVNGVELAVNGGLSPNYRESDGDRAMAEAEISIDIDLGRGSAAETVWTSDFSFDYVRINAEYRT